MQALQNVFSFQEKQVRVVMREGEPWFVARDVCEVLDIANYRNATAKLSTSMKGVQIMDTPGGKQEVTVLNEAGVYKIVFTSNKPEAEKFSDWVAIDVLPAIRKHGMYAKDELLDNPDLLIQVATKLKEERQARLVAETRALVLEQRVAEYEPKITYLDQILQSKDTVTITQIAKDYGMSGQKLNQILNEGGVQYKQNGQWLLYRKHQDKGYTKSFTVDVVHNSGDRSVKMNTRWTQKGRLFIHDLLTYRGIVAMIDRKDIGA
ncbi:phage antirepressor KilAC domain-containing protein [Brevibacillus centrosporus]|uniref:phage antirepressor KilAC domain-containing protein n=1 Tax=Brevibacillus centrosporus TaxID=54910 RepID=UPI002E1E9A2B|nr:phage antirepressor KilAC domain-containing protein [Brevibacillus centrosporus]MED1950471.1 phage antirepressor KilAC domain-containing protein [Brevibacillus centrosporus]